MAPGMIAGLAMLAVSTMGCKRLVLDETRYNPLPQVPMIVRDIAMIDDDGQYTHPYVPGHRTTMDGRVALRVQGGPPGPAGHGRMAIRFARKHHVPICARRLRGAAAVAHR